MLRTEARQLAPVLALVFAACGGEVFLCSVGDSEWRQSMLTCR